MDFEEDTYSSIFLALKHPVRRKILRMLDESPANYTDILNELGVETGFLNYHLESLKGLVTKNEDGRYSLSDFGEAALDLTRRVEEPVKRESRELSLFGFKVGLTYAKASVAILLIGVILISGFYIDLFYRFKEQRIKLTQEPEELVNLNKPHRIQPYVDAEGRTYYMVEGIRVRAPGCTNTTCWVPATEIKFASFDDAEKWLFKRNYTSGILSNGFKVARHHSRSSFKGFH